MQKNENCHISENFKKNYHIADGNILKSFKIIVILKLSYLNMTIFANCHIFKKNTEIVIYDKKKNQW